MQIKVASAHAHVHVCGSGLFLAFWPAVAKIVHDPQHGGTMNKTTTTSKKLGTEVADEFGERMEHSRLHFSKH